MDDEAKHPGNSHSAWPAAPLVAMWALCLSCGFLAGYLIRGSAPSAAPRVVNGAQPQPQAASAPPAFDHPSPAMPHKMPTMEEMKRMADTKAAPLLEKLQSDRNNPQLNNQIGLVYESAHQFKEAARYFEQSLQNYAKNVGVRADYASCLYYTGDVDGALAQLNQSLAYDPKHEGTLINIGIIRWKGKNDVDGAVAAWEKLLQYHPDFPQKDSLRHMIAQAKQSKAAPPAGERPKGAKG